MREFGRREKETRKTARDLVFSEAKMEAKNGWPSDGKQENEKESVMKTEKKGKEQMKKARKSKKRS